jgi:hypothetical protein
MYGEAEDGVDAEGRRTSTVGLDFYFKADLR